MKKLIGESAQKSTFAPADTYPSNTSVVSFLPSFLPKMSSSKPTLASLQTQITELQSQYAALLARVDDLVNNNAAAPAADADAAPAKGKRGAKKEKKPRDPDAPKRPPTAFFAYSTAERAKTPDVKLTASVLSERWKALTDDERAAFKPAGAASDAE